MIILGLDASSTTTGWSIIKFDTFEDAQLLEFGEIELSKFKRKSNPFEYIVKLHNCITEICSKYKIDLAFIEDIFSQNRLTYKSLARMRGICELTLSLCGIKQIGSMQATKARPFVLNQKGLKKEQVCTILEKRFKTKLQTRGYDASDAILIGLAGIKEYCVTNKKSRRSK